MYTIYTQVPRSQFLIETTWTGAGWVAILKYLLEMKSLANFKWDKYVYKKILY